MSKWQEIVNSQKSIGRFVIGAGAVGLFFAHTLKLGYPKDSLFILSKSQTTLPLTVEYVDGRQLEENLPVVLLHEIPQNIFSQIKGSHLYFYVTLPPDVVDKAFPYIFKILNTFVDKKIVTVIFLNNGIIARKEVDSFTNKLNKKGLFAFQVIRALLIAGYVRTQNSNGTLVKNMGGNKIFYCSYNNDFIDSNNIFPKEFFTCIYDRDILMREKAKFITNLLLGLIINNKLIENRKILTIITKDRLEKILENFCNLFEENEIKYEFIREQFLLTLSEAGSNINSISYAWHNGNTQTIDYFVSELKSFMKKSKNKSAKHFFTEFLKEYY